MKAAFAGYFVVATSVATLAFIVPDDQVRQPMWFFLFLVLAFCAKFSWSDPSSPQSPIGWLGYVAGAAVPGAAFACVDVLVHGVSSVSFVFDLFLSLCGSIVALSGCVRSLFLQRR